MFTARKQHLEEKLGTGPARNRSAYSLSGAFKDQRKEEAFLDAIWPERRKVGIAVVAILLVSMAIFAVPMLGAPVEDASGALSEFLMFAGIAALVVAMWFLVTNRPGPVLDIAMFLPSVTMTCFLAVAQNFGMPWQVIPGILMSAMFVYGIFLPHRPGYALATLSVLLVGYMSIGFVGRNFTEPFSVAMVVGIWIACVVMTRYISISKREKHVDQDRLEGLTEQLERHLQDLGLEKHAVERAASENAALADELALARLAAEEKAALLEVVLNNMSQGVLAYGPDAKVVECNRRYAEFMHLPEALTVPGTPVEAIFEHSYAEGLIGDEEERDHAIQSLKHFAQMKDFDPVVIERESAPDLYVEIRIMPMPGGGAVSTVSNITERKLAEQSMRFKALHDPLTGLANRELFGDRLNAAIARSKRVGHYAALAMIDLDRFKPVNDTFGHPMGDQVLKEIGAVLTDTVREIDTVARLGGDEFAIIFDGIAVLRDVSIPIERIFTRLHEPLKVGGQEIVIGASIGVAFYPLDAEAPTDLEQAADRALLDAKRSGRGRCHYYNWKRVAALQDAG